MKNSKCPDGLAPIGALSFGGQEGTETAMLGLSVVPEVVPAKDGTLVDQGRPYVAAMTFATRGVLVEG